APPRTAPESLRTGAPSRRRSAAPCSARARRAPRRGRCVVRWPRGSRRESWCRAPELRRCRAEDVAVARCGLERTAGGTPLALCDERAAEGAEIGRAARREREPERVLVGEAGDR